MVLRPLKFLWRRSGRVRLLNSPLGLVDSMRFPLYRCASWPGQLRRPFDCGDRGVATHGVVMGCVANKGENARVTRLCGGFRVFCWGCVRDASGLREERDSQLCWRGIEKPPLNTSFFFFLQYQRRYCSVEGGRALVLVWANLLVTGGVRLSSAKCLKRLLN